MSGSQSAQRPEVGGLVIGGLSGLWMLLLTGAVLWALADDAPQRGGTGAGSGAGAQAGQGAGAGGAAPSGAGARSGGDSAADGGGIARKQPATTSGSEGGEAGVGVADGEAPRAGTADVSPPVPKGPLAQAALDVPVVITEAPIKVISDGLDGAGNAGRLVPLAEAGTIFDREGRGDRFVYVIDRSGSMEGYPFAVATAHLKASIASLPADARFSVFFYDYQLLQLPMRGLVKASQSNQNAALAWIDGIRAEGGTDPVPAMKAALALKPDTIFLLTDGAFEGDVAATIKQANGRGVSICTIAFHSTEGEAALKQIAADNNGDYRFVPP